MFLKGDQPGGWWLELILGLFQTDEFRRERNAGGAWVAQLVKCGTLDFGSGHDLMVCEMEPQWGPVLTAWSLLGILSLRLSLPLPPVCSCILSLSLPLSQK